MVAGIKGLEINKLCRKSRPFLNEGEARLGPVAHQLLNRAFRSGLALVRNDDPEKRAATRVHSRFFELARHHFAQAFETANLDIGLALELRAHQLVLVCVIARIGGFAAMREPVERRHSQKKMTIINEFRHLPPKEGYQE